MFNDVRKENTENISKLSPGGVTTGLPLARTGGGEAAYPKVWGGDGSVQRRFWGRYWCGADVIWIPSLRPLPQVNHTEPFYFFFYIRKFFPGRIWGWSPAVSSTHPASTRESSGRRTETTSCCTAGSRTRTTQFKIFQTLSLFKIYYPDQNNLECYHGRFHIEILSLCFAAMCLWRLLCVVAL